MSCAELVRRIERIGVRFGQERSVKFETGRVLGERVLLSLHPSDFGQGVLAGITAIAREFSAPGTVTGQFAGALAGAGMVHFGFEGGAGRAICKVYFEYVAVARAAMQKPKPDPVLVHRAFKWDRGDPSRQAVTLYTLRPDAEPAGLAAAIDRSCPLPAFRHLLHETVRLADARLPGLRPMALDVAEAGNPRQSIDINVYPAGLELDDIASLVTPVIAALDAPAGLWDNVLKSRGDKQLGHVAAGLGRDGAPFATVYFGVETRGQA